MAEFNEKTRAIGLSIIFCNGHNRFNLLGNKLNRLCPLQKIIESPMPLGFFFGAHVRSRINAYEIVLKNKVSLAHMLGHALI